MDNKKQNLSDDEKEKIINQINHSFSCEGMHPSTQDVQNALDLLDGTKDVEQLIKEESERIKKEGLTK